MKMCKLGDIIVINNYIGDDNKQINQHSFIVVSDEKGTIAGLEYSMVTSVISSFKNDEQRQKKLKHEENMELPLNSMNEKNFKKLSYVKADKVFYFNKNKIDYYIIASLKDEYLDELLKLILKLASKGKLSQIIDNL